MSNPITQSLKFQEQVLEVIDRVRPYIQSDGGDISLVCADEKTGRVEVALHGACGGCPSASMTLKSGVERMLKDKVPGVTEVVQV